MLTVFPVYEVIYAYFEVFQTSLVCPSTCNLHDCLGHNEMSNFQVLELLQDDLMLIEAHAYMPFISCTFWIL